MFYIYFSSCVAFGPATGGFTGFSSGAANTGLFQAKPSIPVTSSSAMTPVPNNSPTSTESDAAKPKVVAVTTTPPAGSDKGKFFDVRLHYLWLEAIS